MTSFVPLSLSSAVRRLLIKGIGLLSPLSLHFRDFMLNRLMAEIAVCHGELCYLYTSNR